MSAYSESFQSEALVGMAKSFKGAHPGTLTEFVEKNPNAVLLFDEIEKAHTSAIHLFLQLLDGGRLEDKFNEREIAFRDTTVIFTTNAGRKLYDQPNSTGVHKASSSFHRRTILDALETEKDPRAGEPSFPQAICSRMATGYPVLFNHLGVNDLVRVVDAELGRVADLFERQYYKRVSFDELVPMCLVLREGARADARTLCSQADSFVKAEVFKLCRLFKADRLEDAFAHLDRIAFSLEEDRQEMEPGVKAMFVQPEPPKVLMIAGEDITALYGEHVSGVDWRAASTSEDALRILADEDVDMVLLDLWVGGSAGSDSMTIRPFDHVPAAARGLRLGQELLRRIRERLPTMPVYLLSLAESDEGDEAEGSIDEELLMACVRGGGARGMLVSAFVDCMVKGWERHRDRFAATLTETCRQLYRMKAATRMGQERKVLVFDTAPRTDSANRAITIRLRNLHLARAISAADAGEVLEDVERPQVRFDDVVGADSAKEELQFFINYIKTPRRFAALGLRPPKGVLLYGPPGTGKTMLARAMAGESDVSFVSAAASSFVTIWQGSGPQSIRDLFARARRYAPSIVFIDEIDAIGNVRSGGAGGGRGEEMALNALVTEMDGFTSPSPDRPVFVLAATNFKVKSEGQDSPERSTRTLDPALVRRFSRTILVGLPDRAARKKYFAKRLLEDRHAEVADAAVETLAEKSAGMSIADLESVIDSAARAAARKEKAIDEEMLVEALDTAREGEAKEWSPEFLESTSRHEAGHTVMYWLSGA
jgi:ATP-dependent 26S proteasome regulatory subunit